MEHTGEPEKRGQIMYYTMRTILLAAVVFAAGGVLTSAANTAPISNSITQNFPLVLVQGCPRGYNFNYQTGRCYPAYRENRYRDDGYRERGYGYGDRYRGGGCPRGYDMDYQTGRCYRNY